MPKKKIQKGSREGETLPKNPPPKLDPAAQKAELRKLVKRGREQGFITQDEILTIFPAPETDINAVDDLFAKLLSENIDIFDTTEMDTTELTKSVSELEKELEGLASLEEGYLSDPVRMYLREIGR